MEATSQDVDFADGTFSLADTDRTVPFARVTASSFVPSKPAPINPVIDASAPLGVTDFDMPATQERIWRAMWDV